MISLRPVFLPRQGIVYKAIRCRFNYLQNRACNRSVVTSTIDWKPIKTTHNPNEGPKNGSSTGKKVVLGLMFAMPVISFYLGTWQLRRLDWKTKLIASCETKLIYPPISLPKVFTVDMCEDWEYRKVKIKGHFVHEEELFVGPRVKHGEKGYLLFTPFIREDTGEKILVERGWIAEAKVSPDTRTLTHLSLPSGKDIELICIVRPPKKRGKFQWKQEDKESRLWQVSDIYDMAASVDCKPIHFQALYDMTNHASWMNNETESHEQNLLASIRHWVTGTKKIDIKSIADDDDSLAFTEWQFMKAGVPIGKTPTVDFRNSHLQYLVTWYGLSFLSTIFLIVALKKMWKGGVISQSQLKKEKLKHARKYT
ncbi:hypothetical protein KAFR_0C02360 [Kazachstania africana CBS 2517]|uniref:SURF1-like protein n=1 Tax=Kazachstania africana (strain ATCC 22294 / BCRC 22015 / CBS 2517 / CECT 1963 / NBRC 1671 / NRRL Y-8276) TaxID=1071382 RepID=H2AS79_KAZAF|nr:hypothetical protein KAFR_0C02360 [Kazachstania africana CBS 2517]CCF57229.1 hypothetical protein KAFR_0C02360 [Kazachstania africana CBS 2517]